MENRSESLTIGVFAQAAGLKLTDVRQKLVGLIRMESA